MMLSRRSFLGATSIAMVSQRDAQASPEFELKMGTGALNDINMRNIEAVSQAIQGRSEGRIRLTFFSDNGEKGAATMLNRMRAGEIDMTLTPSLTTLSYLVPAAGLPSIGFAFQSSRQALTAMDGNLGEYVRSAIEKANIAPIGKVWDGGFRQITSTSSWPIDNGSDLRNFRVCVRRSALLISTFSAMLAAPFVVNDIRSALNRQEVDGQESVLSVVMDDRLYDVQTHCAMTNHCWTCYWPLANLRLIQSLPSNLLDIVKISFDEAAIQQQADAIKSDHSLRLNLAARGIIFNDPDPASFRAKLSESGYYKAWKKYYREEGWLQLEQFAGKLT
jgi:TRAP-type transport system periplasmic protein